MIMEWDSRMKNTHAVQILKAAIPFFDVSVGEVINLEGLFQAVRPHVLGRERRLIDMVLQFFQMKHMMEMMQFMQMMQEMQRAQEEQTQGMDGDGAGEGVSGMMGGMNPMELIRTMVPPEQQDTVEMMMSMMTAMQDNAEQTDGEQEAPFDT